MDSSSNPTGNLTGGDKLTAFLDRLSRQVSNSGVLQVGFLEGATYPDGESVAKVAAIQEFGAPRAAIPPRPFFRTMIQQKEGEWGPALAKLLEGTNYDAKRALGQLGAGIEGQLRQSIVDTMAPPLRPITLMLRAMKAANPALVVTGAVVAEAAARVAAGKPYPVAPSSKPLIETGHMLASISSQVVDP